MGQTHQGPETKTYHPEPERSDPEWLVWAAWADRVTFEEIQRNTGLSERQVIREMRKQLTDSTFKRWRRRVSQRATKHRKRFKVKRRQGQVLENESLCPLTSEFLC